MLLNEFFGTKVFNVDEPEKRKDDDKIKESELADQIFEFLLNDDELHKKHFLPIARKLKLSKSKEKDPSVWIPYVNDTCLKFHKDHKIIESPKDVFTKELRKDLCRRCCEHFNEDIFKDNYKVV